MMAILTQFLDGLIELDRQGGTRMNALVLAGAAGTYRSLLRCQSQGKRSPASSTRAAFGPPFLFAAILGRVIDSAATWSIVTYNRRVVWCPLVRAFRLAPRLTASGAGPFFNLRERARP